MAGSPNPITQFADSLRGRLNALGLAMLDGEFDKLQHFMREKLHVPQPLQVIEQVISEIEAKGSHRFLVEKLNQLAAPTLNPVKDWKVHKQNIGKSLAVYPAAVHIQLQHLRSTSALAGPVVEQLQKEIEEEITKAQEPLKQLSDSEQADSTLIQSLEGTIEETATGIENTGPGILVAGVLFVMALIQGGLDVFNDVLEALAALSVGQIVAGILAVAATAAGVALFIWLQSQQGLQGAPSPPPKPGGKPTPVPVPTPTNLAQELYEEAQREGLKISLAVIQEIIRENPGLTKDQYKLLMKLYLAGFTTQQIREMIRTGRAGFTKDQLAIVLKRTQDALAKGTDRPGPDGRTADELRKMFVAIANALNSNDEEFKLEGEVALFVLLDLVTFHTAVYDSNGVQVGEIDVETIDAFIEVTTDTDDKLSQIKKELVNRDINPRGKPVVLYGPSYAGRAAQELLEQLRPNAKYAKNPNSLRKVLDTLKRRQQNKKKSGGS